MYNVHNKQLLSARESFYKIKEGKKKFDYRIQKFFKSIWDKINVTIRNMLLKVVVS